MATVPARPDRNALLSAGVRALAHLVDEVLANDVDPAELLELMDQIVAGRAQVRISLEMLPTARLIVYAVRLGPPAQHRAIAEYDMAVTAGAARN